MKKIVLLIGMAIAAFGGSQDASATTPCVLACDADFQDCLGDHHSPKSACVSWHK